MPPAVPAYEVPGRGAWSLKGGLLRLRPGHVNRFGYYRAPTGDEVMIGRAGSRPGATYSEYVVNLAVRSWQRMLGVPPDGLFGKVTERGVTDFQRTKDLDPDGILGPATASALLRPLAVSVARDHRVPVGVLGGIAAKESSWDLAAVGEFNGCDTGICQINLKAHRSISPDSAVRPEFALTWSAEDLRSVFETWDGRTRADPWDIAIAHHNSPRLALAWAKDPQGRPPYSEVREENGHPQIGEYVAACRAAWIESDPVRKAKG